MNTELWAINHKPGTGVFGGASKEFFMDERVSEMDGRHQDMRAPWYIYSRRKVAAIVGFHGYRKFMNLRDEYVKGSELGATWEQAPLDRFLGYQHWLTQVEPIVFQRLLTPYDVITVEPFDCSYNGNMEQDYIKSRSKEDWDAFAVQMDRCRYSRHLLFTPLIRPMHFLMRDYTFHRFMRDWEDVMKPLETKIKSLDSRDPDYPRRALAFLSERFWSIWLDANPHLRIKTVPLMICWDAK